MQNETANPTIARIVEITAGHNYDVHMTDGTRHSVYTQAQTWGVVWYQTGQTGCIKINHDGQRSAHHSTDLIEAVLAARAAQVTPVEPPTVALAAGWASMHRAKTCHFFRGGKALCGKSGNPTSRLQPDLSGIYGTCSACSRKVFGIEKPKAPRVCKAPQPIRRCVAICKEYDLDFSDEDGRRAAAQLLFGRAIKTCESLTLSHWGALGNEIKFSGLRWHNGEAFYATK
jgi:hypothetical protein